MPNRFDRRLKGSGLKPGEGSCSKNKKSNLSYATKYNTSSLQQSTRIMKRTHQVSNQNTKIQAIESNKIDTNDINVKKILSNHSTFMKKIKEQINVLENKNTELKEGIEKNINFTYQKISQIEGFLDTITVEEKEVEPIVDSSNQNLVGNDILAMSKEIIVDKITNNKNRFEIEILDSTIKKIKDDIQNDNQKIKEEMTELTNNISFRESIFLKTVKLMNKKIDLLKADNFEKNTKIKALTDKIENLNKTVGMLKHMCVENDNFIKKYRHRKEKIITEKKQNMKPDILGVEEYDRKYELRGVPDRLLNGLKNVEKLK